MAVFFSYLGSFALLALIIGMFKPEWFKRLKLHNKKQVAVAFGGTAILFGLISTAIDPTATQVTSTNSNVSSSTPTPVPTATPTPTPTPEPFNIVVTSQIVKKVGGKHRYFFDIRNQDNRPFEGSVGITVRNDSGMLLSGDSFKTTSPLGVGLGRSVYLDANTGPTSIHGSSGVTKFTYGVQVNGVTVKSGEGAISDKYENLSL